ncbi:MAG: tetratricopeptide repeat protein [Acidobacteria bacterium]|nr:tetratricopeptide repeat protein [Acidobacteriota bacterium]
MSKLCRICGATPLPGARFCRACGAPLSAMAAPDTGNTVSPQAQTIPFAGEGRPTDGISPDDNGYAGADTARVKQDEIDRLLRQTPAGLESRASGTVAAAELSQTPATVDPRFAETVSEAQAPIAQPSTSDGAGKAANASKTASKSRRIWQAAAALLLVIALTAGALAYFFSRQSAANDEGGATPIAISDQKKLVQEQLTEADALLASGDTDGAITKLRYAVKLDPANAEAHRRLGLALEKKGERREAINEYRAATENDSSNTAAWRALASAQFAEGLYAESAESYARIIQAMNEKEVDDNLRLDYADALRLAGRTEEARALYQKVSASESLDLAHRASEQLAQLPQSQTGGSSSATPDARSSTTAQNRATDENATASQTNVALPAPVQPAAPAPANTTTTTNNGASENGDDRYYAQALNIVQGRDVKTLQRAELLRALQLFQNVKGGSHAGDARKYADRLGKEYDRRRKVN